MTDRAFCPAIAAMSIVLLSSAFAAQSQAKLPPISYTCPMHADVVEDAAGICPICKMKLEPIRLDSVYSCPIHSIVQETNPGKCPICRRELVQLTVQLSFGCPGRPAINTLDRGKCPDGSSMEPRYTARAHGNHNPQHNGGFFMAEDNWHHLEGTYPEAGVFRLYLYDDYTKPLPPDQTKLVQARVITKKGEYPLKLSANGRYLETTVDPAAPPVEMTAKVRFKADQPKDFTFDFAFPSYSRDTAANSTEDAGVTQSAVAIEIPNDTRAVLKLLTDKAQELKGFVESRQYAQLWVPAFQSKDLALALDVRTRELPAHERGGATASIDRLVRSAWLLDAYGDTGDRAQIEQAYVSFAEAVDQVTSVYAGLSGAK